MLFKDLTDEQLVVEARTLRTLTNNALDIKQRNAPIAKWLRELDLIINIKRQRQRAGTWTGPDFI